MRPSDAAGLVAPLAHLWFGALGGVAFGVIRRFAPGIPGGILGVLFGLGVYAVSYKGWIPALGILPPPEDDRPGRPAVMIARPRRLWAGARLADPTTEGVTLDQPAYP